MTSNPMQEILRQKMYVTKPLSMYKNSSSALSLPPPEGPNSGILVIHDEEMPMSCYGQCKKRELERLPFPQNKNLMTCFATTTQYGLHFDYDRVVLIPVLNQPLSSDLYYAIEPRGKHKGEAFTCSKEEDKTTCCIWKCVSEKIPQPFDPDNIYQQFKICTVKGYGFYAKSVAPDGYPPLFLRRYWDMKAETPKNFELGEALGLDSNLRAQLPDFNFPLSHKNSKPVVVGKWYSPFIFIKDGTSKQQISNSMYYEITLEQRWERVFTCENSHNAAFVNVVVQTEVVSFGGTDIVPDEENVVNGVIWFKSSSKEGGERSVGLSTVIVERMKWEEERFGWIGGNDKQVSLRKVEEYGRVGWWRKFGCYVLVESFVLKRMDGSLILTYDFKHTHHTRSKWE